MSAGPKQFKLKRNASALVIGLLLLSMIALSYQNCGVPTVESSAGNSLGTYGGNPNFRLPQGGGDSPSMAPTSCSVSGPSMIPIGGSGQFIVTSTQTLSQVTTAIAYGNKNAQRDGSEVYPLSYPVTDLGSGRYQIIITNADGTMGGQYQRVFEIRDSLGRALCQTGVIQFQVLGNDCNLRPGQNVYPASGGYALFADYLLGTGSIPSGASMRIEGFDQFGPNLTAITPIVPPGHQTVIPFIPPGAFVDRWILPITSAMANKDLIRRLVVYDALGNVYCRSNYTRFSITN